MVIRDVGAYTLSLWSRHCSRGMPRVIGLRDGGSEFMVLREAESPEAVIEFWGSC